VRRGLSIHHLRSGLLDHPPSRVMTAGNAGRDCANGYRFAKWQGKPNFALR